MSTFLTIKWENVKFIFLLNVGSYFIFLCFLTAYILLPEPYNTLNDGGAARNTTDTFSFNDGNITSGMNNSNVISQLKSSKQIFLWLSLMAVLGLLFLRELLHMILYPWNYVQSPENWLQLLMIIAAFISCSGVVDGRKIKLHSLQSPFFWDGPGFC